MFLAKILKKLPLTRAGRVFKASKAMSLTQKKPLYEMIVCLFL